MRVTLFRITAALSMLMVCSAMARRDDTPINSATELRDWCKAASEAYFIGTGKTPYNWTASYWDQANVLMVRGSWRIDVSKVTVECQVARGARADSATMTVAAPEPSSD